MIPTNPLNYTESLFLGILSTAFVDTPYAGKISFMTGQNDQERTSPGVVIYAATADTPSELPDWLRNYIVSLTVLVISPADVVEAETVSGLPAHREIVQLVLDKLRDTPGIQAQAALDGHKVYDVEPKATQPDMEDRKFGTEIQVTVNIVLDLEPAG